MNKAFRREIDNLGWELVRDEVREPIKYQPDVRERLLLYRTKESTNCPLCHNGGHRHVQGVVSIIEGDSAETISRKVTERAAECLGLMRQNKTNQEKFEAMISK